MVFSFSFSFLSIFIVEWILLEIHLNSDMTKEARKLRFKNIYFENVAWKLFYINSHNLLCFFFYYYLGLCLWFQDEREKKVKLFMRLLRKLEWNVLMLRVWACYYMPMNAIYHCLKIIFDYYFRFRFFNHLW